MADDEVTPFGTPTTNYGWTKPTVGGDVDAWGGLINTDLDGIDSTVKSVSTVANAAYPATNPSGYQTAAQVTAALPVASSTTPVMDGVAAVGTGTTWARADHIHPVDTSRYAASNPSGFQTAAQVTASLGAYAPLAGATFTGNIAAPGVSIQGGGALNLNQGASQYQSISWVNTGAHTCGTIYVDYTNQVVNINNPAPVNTVLQLDNAGNFNYVGGSGQATKAGGGSWIAPSDARIKTVIGDYKAGLDEIIKLAPVVYTYKGNDTRAEGEPSGHAHLAEIAKPFVGLVAQAVEPVMPEMVTKSEAWIDGAKVDDLRSLDTTPLIFALVNAVKELKAEIEVLKAPPPVEGESSG